jgi:hypothetical protein
VLLLALPVLVVLGNDSLAIALLKRRARRLGVPDKVLAKLRQRLRRLPPRFPPYATKELLDFVRSEGG